MKEVNRDSTLNNVKYVDFPTTQKEILRAIFCLTHDAAIEEPNEAMKCSQAVLNLANALSVPSLTCCKTRLQWKCRLLMNI